MPLAIRDVMTSPVKTIPHDVTLEYAEHAVREYEVRHLPVVKHGRAIGVISQKDLLLLRGLPGYDPKGATVEEAVGKNLFAVAPETPVAEVTEVMVQRRIGSAVVVDASGAPIGIFTSVDALNLVTRLTR